MFFYVGFIKKNQLYFYSKNPRGTPKSHKICGNKIILVSFYHDISKSFQREFNFGA